MTQQSQGVSYEIGKKERDARNFSGRAAEVHVRFVRGWCFRLSFVVFVYIIKRTLHGDEKI